MATISEEMIKSVLGNAKTAHDAIERAKKALDEIKKLDGTTKQEATFKTAVSDEAAVKKEYDKFVKAVTKEEDYKKTRDKVTKLMNEAVKLDKAVAAELVEAKKPKPLKDIGVAKLSENAKEMTTFLEACVSGAKDAKLKDKVKSLGPDKEHPTNPRFQIGSDLVSIPTTSHGSQHLGAAKKSIVKAMKELGFV